MKITYKVNPINKEYELIYSLAFKDLKIKKLKDVDKYYNEIINYINDFVSIMYGSNCTVDLFINNCKYKKDLDHE